MNSQAKGAARSARPVHSPPSTARWRARIAVPATILPATKPTRAPLACLAMYSHDSSFITLHLESPRTSPTNLQHEPPQYQSKRGRDTCDECPAGTARASPGQKECKPCDPGTFANTTGFTTCALCDPGSFQEQLRTIQTHTLVKNSTQHLKKHSQISTRRLLHNAHATKLHLHNPTNYKHDIHKTPPCYKFIKKNKTKKIKTPPTTPGFYSEPGKSTGPIACKPCPAGYAVNVAGQVGRGGGDNNLSPSPHVSV